MAFKPFLYYLVESDGRVRQIVNGIVTSLNKKTPLLNSPAGWSEILIKWARNVDRHGQIRTFSLPLGFVRDGGKILRNDMYKFNIDRELYLLIQVLTSTIDDTNYSSRYNFLYKGQLDFSTFEDDPGGSMVNINIMEGGISKLVKANENTQYLIPFDADAININMDGLALDKTGNFVLVDELEMDNVNFGGFAFSPVAFINSDGNAYGIAFTTQQPERIDGTISYDDVLQSPNWMGEAGPTNGSTVTARITGKIVYKCTKQEAANGFKMRFLRSGLPITNQDDYELFTDSPLVINQTYSHDIDISVPLVPGERLYLEQFLGTTGETTAIQFTADSKLSVAFTFKAQPTFIKAFKPIDVYKKLCIKLSIDVNKVVSDLLSTCTYCLTSGDGIRGLGGGIKTSLNDFLKAYDIYLFAGMQIKSTIEIETRYKYYDSVDPVVLGNCRDMKIVPATDRMFSSIIFGHAEQEIDDVNGKYDPNGQLTYTTPIKAGGGKKLEMISPYKAGPYEIEIIRINLEGKTTTDAQQDNQVFVIDVSLAGSGPRTATVTFNAALHGFTITSAEGLVKGQKIRITGSASNDGEYMIEDIASIVIAQLVVLSGSVIDEAGVSVTITVVEGAVFNLDRSVIPTSGVPSPLTIFNVRLRPGALLALHYRWLHSMLYNYEPGIIKFEQGNRNTDMVVDGLKDGRDIIIANMGAIMWKPYYFEFGTKVPIDLVQTLDTKPNKAFTTTWNGDDYTGFLIEAGIAPNTRQPQTYNLLCSPETDVTKLIV